MKIDKRYQPGTAATQKYTDNYQSIFTSIAEAIIIWNEAGCILEVNPSACACFGYSHEALLALQMKQLLAPEDAEQIPEHIRSLLWQGHIAYEAVLKSNDGALRQSWVNASKIEWDGQTAFCNIYRLFEPKQDKVQLGDSEVRLRAITDSTRDGIVMLDEKGLVSYWNPAAEQIFGYTASETRGRNLHTLLAPSRYHKEHAAAFRQF